MNTSANKNFLQQQVDSDTILRKREEFAVSLRKQKTQQVLRMKRRKIAEQLASKGKIQMVNYPGFGSGAALPNYSKSIPEMLNRVYEGYIPWKDLKYEPKDKILSQLKTRLGAPDRIMFDSVAENIGSNIFIYEAATQNQGTGEEFLALMIDMRLTLSSKDASPDIGELVNSTKLIDFIISVLRLPASFSPSPEQNFVRWQKLEAIWILINLAFGEEDVLLQILARTDLIEELRRLTESDAKRDLQMMDLIFYFWGNITGTSTLLRQKVRGQFSVLKMILSILNENDSVIFPFAQNYLWLTYNISEEKGSLSEEEVMDILQVLARFFQYTISQQDEENLTPIVKGLTNIAETCSTTEGAHKIACLNHSDFNIIALMCSCLASKNQDIFSKAERFIGILLSFESSKIPEQVVLNGGIDSLLNITYGTNQNHVKESVWTLGNLAASGQQFANKLVQPAVISRLITLSNGHNLDVRCEAIFTLCNLITIGSTEACRRLFEFESGAVVESFRDALTCFKEKRILMEILLATSKLLQTDEDLNLVGQSNCVFFKMANIEFGEALGSLSTVTSQDLFDLGQEVYEIYTRYENEYCNDDDVDIVGGANQEAAELERVDGQAHDEQMFNI